jgi:PKD repeat protein
MPSYAVSATTNVTGHTFELNKLGCNLGGCHLSGVPDVEGQQTTTTNNLSRLAELFRIWATNKAPAILGTTAYNASKENSWEFNTIGALATATNAGPVATNQVKLPEAIRQARFNAYMVLHDGSLGVHNPRYSAFLLRDAEIKVLNQFSVAKFTANTFNIFTNTAMYFTNLNSAVTGCNWDFGDGTTSTSTSAAVQHLYANAGAYTVTLTATDATGTETLVRTNYIIVYNKPIPSFTMTPNGGPKPLTVSFNNTSSFATYYRWTFMANVTNVLYSNEPNPPPFTYTNAGTYHVALRAYNEGGSVTITNVLTVTP